MYGKRNYKEKDYRVCDYVCTFNLGSLQAVLEYRQTVLEKGLICLGYHSKKVIKCDNKLIENLYSLPMRSALNVTKKIKILRIIHLK